MFYIFRKLFITIVSTICALTLSACGPTWLAGATGLGTLGQDERTAGKVLDDNTIYAEINHYFIQTDVYELLMDVTIRVHNGRVMLTGQTKTHDTAHEAVRLSWIANGVTEVINNIEITEPGTLLDTAKDEWIEKQIGTRLLLTSYIRSMNYTVEVVNGVVYLLGVAQSEKELRTVAHIASITKGVIRVVSHVRLKDKSDETKNAIKLAP